MLHHIRYLCILALLLLSSTTAQGSDTARAGHELFTAVLTDHVAKGAVDYTAIRNDRRFHDYLKMLKTVDPASLSGAEKLAFWLNVYNASTIRIVCDNLPLKSIRDVPDVWDAKLVHVKGRSLSLNEVEHDIIRPLGDPRIHMALVCAARSCPPLRSEAYEAGKLDTQLDDQVRRFMTDGNSNVIDVAGRRVRLSRIFEWYRKDFAGDDAGLLRYVAKYLPAETAAAIRAQATVFTVTYLDYDWSLNGRPAVR